MYAPLIILSGPSGVGKTTMTNHLLTVYSFLRRVITVTTRMPRPGEQQGVDYFFTSDAAFTQLLLAHAFLETNQFGAYAYATPRSVLTGLSRGIPHIILPDINGAHELKKSIPHAVTIWLEASEEVLRARLAGRNTESATEQERRIARAKEEMAAARATTLYDHYINMHDFSIAAAAIEKIVYASLAGSRDSLSSSVAGSLPISRKTV